MGLTDEEIGLSATKPKSGNPSSQCKGASPPDPEDPDQANSSSANTSCQGDPAGEPLALGDATIGSSELKNDAAPRDMTLEYLAKTADVDELADRQGPSQTESSRQHTEGDTMNRTEQEGGRGGTQQLADVETRRGSGNTRGIGPKEHSARWAWSRRGTEECSLYFRSDSGCEGHRMASPSRRTSMASNSDAAGNGGKGGKGKRTVYLGRTQAFPLRRVESSLAVDARGFGLSGVSADAVGEEFALDMSWFF